MTASAWTKDRIERLAALWKEGKTAEQVARDLGDGISRSAVLGKVYRMGLSDQRVSPATNAAAVRPAPMPKASAVCPPDRRSSGGDRDQPQEPGRASLLTVGRHQCRWPIGDPRSPAFSLCGGPSVRGAYCACHAQIAYRPRGETSRTLEQLAGLA